MADEPEPPHSISAKTGRAGDVPDAIRRRYLLDDKGGPGVGFYVDARVTVAAFRDQGRVLAAMHSDPNAIRDMTAIARHRGWLIVTARGSTEFRREAWFQGRAAGLEVRGYRPTERDLQELERRRARQQGQESGSAKVATHRSTARDAGVKTRLDVVDAVVRARVVDPAVQDRAMAAARSRVARWLEQGARFDPLRVPARPLEPERPQRRDRRR